MITSWLTYTDRGIYCPVGDFYLDPWLPVEYAVISHGHADHARWGMGRYLCQTYSVPILQHRLGADIRVQGMDYGKPLLHNGVEITFFPAGHLIGSAQIRLRYQGESVVFTGDYKTTPDGVSTPYEPVRCDVFITESTFGLPVYRWQADSALRSQMTQWIEGNIKDGRTSVLFAYSLGKAQRLMALLEGVAPIYTHNAITRTNEAILRNDALTLPETYPLMGEQPEAANGHIVIAPPALLGAKMIKKLQRPSTAICSGWMHIRGKRRWKGVDAGFAVSDHADWPGLLDAVRASDATRIFVTHGQQAVFAKYLCEQGYDAHELLTQYDNDGEQDD